MYNLVSGFRSKLFVYCDIFNRINIVWYFDSNDIYLLNKQNKINEIKVEEELSSMKYINMN